VVTNFPEKIVPIVAPNGDEVSSLTAKRVEFPENVGAASLTGLTVTFKPIVVLETLEVVLLSVVVSKVALVLPLVNVVVAELSTE
jgi:hypothetical protein